MGTGVDRIYCSIDAGEFLADSAVFLFPKRR
jgi:hypothetical protein